MIPSRSLIVIFAFLGALVATDSSAQGYPTRPIKMIAPYPPGGGVDVVARAIAERLSPRLGQPITVENRPGAGATIGADALVKSAPDGYTVMVGSMVDYSLTPHFHPNLSFNMRRDIAAVAEIGYGTIALVVHPEVPATSVKELIALAKAKPGQLSFASSGTGGLIHLNGEMFKQMAGVEMVHIPYKGSTQFQPDLIAGRVPMSIDNVLAHLPHLKTGKLRVLAVGSRARSPLLPDVPTMAEAGLPGFESATNYTLFAPTGTPREAITVLNREVNAIIAETEVRDRLLALGIVVSGGTPEAVQARIPIEMDRWTKVIRTGNIRVE